jgi:hypothetical protein
MERKKHKGYAIKRCQECNRNIKRAYQAKDKILCFFCHRKHRSIMPNIKSSAAKDISFKFKDIQSMKDIAYDNINYCYKWITIWFLMIFLQVFLLIFIKGLYIFVGIIVIVISILRINALIGHLKFYRLYRNKLEELS